MNPFVLGTWFALIAGLGDVFLYFLTSVVLHRYMHLTPELIWISPVSHVVLFALPAIILWGLARWRPARYWSFATAALFAFLTAWSLSTYATRVHPTAAFVLALGIATESSWRQALTSQRTSASSFAPPVSSPLAIGMPPSKSARPPDA